MPPNQTSGGCCNGLRANGDALEVEPRAVVVDRLLRPESADQRKCLVEPLRPVAALDAEGLLLLGIGYAEAECGQRPTA